MKCSFVAFSLCIPLCLCTTAKAVPILGPGGNYYEYVQTGLPTAGAGSLFSDALAAAAGMTFLGVPGHLATVTSMAEDDLLKSLLPAGNAGWLGGSDEAIEGEWRWVVGPEAGSLFWLGGSGGTPVGYASFPPGEPNNAGGFGPEDFLIIGGGNLWNDVASVPGSGVNGFFVEFETSAVPEPSSLVLFTLGMIGVTIGVRRNRRK